MEITSYAIRPASAKANGVDILTASAVIMTGTIYEKGVKVVFTIASGNAFFINGQKSISVVTNSLGGVSADFVDNISETVVIEVTVENDTSAHQSLTASFTPSDSAVDSIYLLLTVDDAKADGEDQNQAELQTLSGTTPVANTSVSLALTNGAKFINGRNQADIKTDNKGRASLPFSSTIVGESKLTAYLSDNIAIYNSVTATFLSASPEISLELEVVTDGAQANGVAFNTVLATVKERDNGNPLSGQNITFSIINGSAVFDNNQITYTLTTDSNGEAYVSLKDNEVENVNIEAVVGDQTATTVVQFSQTRSPVKIERVYNLNKTFPARGPSTAWLGAIFSATAVGGSGTYKWEVNSTKLNVVSNDESSYKADFTFIQNYPEYATYTITVTDTVTNEQDTYNFKLNSFFTHYADPKTYAEMLLIGFHNCPTTDELLDLYSDWGNMSQYGFVLSVNWGWYWSSDSNALVQTKVRLVDGRSASGLEQLIACCYSNVYRR